MCEIGCCGGTRTDRIHTYYEKNFSISDENYKILGWESSHAHFVRFSVLFDNLELSGKSLLDVGCGFGDLYRFAQLEKKVHVEYLGVDISLRMIEQAKLQNPGVSFLCEDIFAASSSVKEQSFDFVYSSGIFNLALGNNIEFLESALVRFNRIARRGFAFSLLSDSSPDKEEQYYYYPPKQIEKLLEPFCLSQIKIIDGYLPNDFSVICVKRDND